MADLIGRRLGGLKLTRELGRGGFGTVYLGEPQGLMVEAALDACLAVFGPVEDDLATGLLGVTGHGSGSLLGRGGRIIGEFGYAEFFLT